MKKHFLLLALMILLPFTAWADGELTVTIKRAIMTYKGSPVVPEVTVKQGATTLTVDTDYDLSW